MDVDVKWDRKDGILIAILAGRIDGSNAQEVQSLIESGIGPEDTALLLDFEQLSYISSAGLRLGVIIAWKFKDPGKQFGICALTGGVRKVITMSGFDQIIDIYESQNEAIAAYGSS